MTKIKTNITKHALIPKQIKLSEKDKNELFKKYGISFRELPKIKKNDPAIANMDIKPGDIIKITRKSPTAGEIEFYRAVS